MPSLPFECDYDPLLVLEFECADLTLSFVGYLLSLSVTVINLRSLTWQGPVINE